MGKNATSQGPAGYEGREILRCGHAPRAIGGLARLGRFAVS